jgi:hypothetical protein
VQDGVEGNDVADGGPHRDVVDADPGDLLESAEFLKNCSGRV